jgi:hypothetical protein
LIYQLEDINPKGLTLIKAVMPVRLPAPLRMVVTSFPLTVIGVSPFGLIF